MLNYGVALSGLSMTQTAPVMVFDATTCMPNCEGNVRGIFTQFSCTDAADAACLCASQNFFSGIRDCSAQACSAKADDIKKYLDGSFCQDSPIPDRFVAAVVMTGPAPAAPASTDSTDPSTSQAAQTRLAKSLQSSEASATSTSPPSATASVKSVVSLLATSVASLEAVSSSDIASSSVLLVASTAPPATTAIPSAEPSSTLASLASISSAPISSAPVSSALVLSPSASKLVSSASIVPSSSGLPPARFFTAAPEPTESSDATGTNEAPVHSSDNKLSRTAVIGIGVGAAAAGIATLATIACFLLKRRSQLVSTRPMGDISAPMSMYGQSPASISALSCDKPDHDDLEILSNRYDDMPSRQVPRTMV